MWIASMKQLYLMLHVEVGTTTEQLNSIKCSLEVRREKKQGMCDVISHCVIYCDRPDPTID